MGYLPIAGVQKIFHLDVAYPQFPTREEILEFFVDGVKVTAIANHAWRRISVKIIEPFQITAWTYFPPFFGLGFFMLKRQAELAQKGITSREDFITRSRSAYRIILQQPEERANQTPHLRHQAGRQVGFV